MTTTRASRSELERARFINSAGLIPFVEGARAKLYGRTIQANPYGIAGCEFLDFRRLWSDGYYAMGSEIRDLMTEAGHAYAAGRPDSIYVDGSWKDKMWRAFVLEFEKGEANGQKNLKNRAADVVAKIGKAVKINDCPENLRMGLFVVDKDYKGPMAYSYVRFANNKVLFAYKSQSGFWHLFHYTKGEKVGESVLSTNAEHAILTDMHTRSRGAGQIGRHWHIAGAYDAAFGLTGVRPEGDEYIATGEDNLARFPIYTVVKRDLEGGTKGA